MIVASHQPLGVKSAGEFGIDVMNNTRRSFARTSTGELMAVPARAALRGVWEALAESSVVMLENEGELVSAWNESLLSGRQPAVLHPRSAETKLADTFERISRDIEDAVSSGLVAVLPQAPSATKTRAWWKIDPTSGVTLGVTDNGWGGSYLIAASQYVSDIPQRKIMIGIACLGAANGGCRVHAKVAVSTIHFAVMTGGKASCKALFLASVLSNLPPGIADVCDAIDLGSAHVLSVLSRLEQPVWRRCFPQALEKCLEAAAAAP
jgi:hypothetical protein